MIKMVAIATFAVISAGQLANASSGKSWDALYAKVNGTCIGQSGLNTPEASAPIVFDDSTGKIAVLLRETAGSGKRKNGVICLYDKKSGRASISEYRWLGY